MQSDWIKAVSGYSAHRPRFLGKGLTTPDFTNRTDQVSQALPTFYPKSEEKGLVSLLRYAELWHCDQKLVYPIRMLFELLTS